MNSYITIHDLRLYAFHGVGAQERTVGNEYTINLCVETDMRRAFTTDDVTDTVNYAEICQTIKQEMTVPSNLLEYVAGRIAKALFQRFPDISSIDLQLVKRNPPMGTDCKGAGVRLCISRNDLDKTF